jgi:type IV secretory pathway TraG/TraD family ATPase VirD4
VKALLVACFVIAASAVGIVLARPQIVTAYHTVEIAAAWPPHVVATIPRVHLIPRLAHGWRPMPWPQWTDPRAQARRLTEINGPSSVGQLMRIGLWVEVAAVILIVVLPLLRTLWAPLWFVVGRAGTLKPGTAHGAARWASRRDARRWRPRRGAGSFVLGRVMGMRRTIALPDALVYVHTLLVGRSGSGKSTLLIGLLLREIERRVPRSIVVTDPKGELYERTSAALSRTHMVLRLNFYDPRGAGDNPLAHIGADPERALSFARTWVANTRRQDASEGGFWDDTVLLLIQAVALHLNALNKPGTLSQLAQYLGRTDIKAMQRELLESPDPHARDAAQGFLIHLKADPTLAEKVLTGLPLRFMGLKGEAIQAVTDHDDMPFEGMGLRAGRPIALFVQLTPGRQDTLRPFVATLFGQMWDAQIARANTYPDKALPRAILNLIDEAGTIGAIAGLLHALNTLRAARIGVLLAFQSPTQMSDAYGVDAPAAFEDGCNNLLFFAGAGPTTAQWMSDTLGTRTVVSASAGASRERERVFTQGGSTGKSETGAPLIGADELRALPKGTLIVSEANERPFMVRVIRWDKTRLRRRAGCMTSPTHSNRNKPRTEALVAPVATAIPAPTPPVEDTPPVEEMPAHAAEEMPAHGTDEGAIAVMVAPPEKAATPRTKAPPKSRKPRATVPAEDPVATARKYI